MAKSVLQDIILESINGTVRFKCINLDSGDFYYTVYGSYLRF